MGVNGRQGDTVEALELPGCESVIALNEEIHDSQREQDQSNPRQAVGHYHQHAQEPVDVGQEDVEDEWQAVIHTVHV